ncbi:MAG: hypothetical protein KGL95_08625, partial [Patescibacteria group bacterium]|nr:hypothetical protein [Patescibacteria group bacterium]
NLANDFAIGGNSTASAKFQIFANGNATTSGNLTFNTAGQIATTNMQNLTIGGTTTGNIVLNPLNGTGTVTLQGYTSGIIHSTNGVLSSSAVNLASSDVTGVLPLSNGGTNSNLTAVSGGVIYSTSTGFDVSAAGSNSFCLTSNGTATPTWAQCATGPTAGINYWTMQNGSLSTINNTADLLVGGVSTNSAKFAVVNVSGTNTPIASVSAGLGGATYIAANGFLQTTNDQTLTIGGGNTGNIVITPLSSVTISTLGSGIVRSTNGLLSASSVNLNSSDVSNVLPVTHGGTGLSTITSGALLYGNATGNVNTLSPAANGNVLVSNGTSPAYTTALTALTQLTSSGTIQFSSLGFGVVHTDTNGTLTSSAVNLANSDVTGILPLANGGTNANLTAVSGGVVYSNGSALAISTAGSNGYCLVSTSTSAPVWQQCATGPTAGINYWTLQNGALNTINNTADLLVGGVSTNSAKFAVLGVNTTTTTASVSGQTGSLVLDNTGSIQTTADQNLTIGGGATGNITLNPLNTVTVNGAQTINGTQTVNGNLTATGTIDFSNLGIGVVHAGSGGVLSSSAVN